MQQYGLTGFLVVFLVLGPGFTYVRTKHTRLKLENEAQELLNTVLVEERKHADALEQRLNEALVRLEAARNEVFQLRLELAEAQHKLEQMPRITQQMQTISSELDTLKAQLNEPEEVGGSSETTTLSRTQTGE